MIVRRIKHRNNYCMTLVLKQHELESRYKYITKDVYDKLNIYHTTKKKTTNKTHVYVAKN